MDLLPTNHNLRKGTNLNLENFSIFRYTQEMLPKLYIIGMQILRRLALYTKNNIVIKPGQRNGMTRSKHTNKTRGFTALASDSYAF